MRLFTRRLWEVQRCARFNLQLGTVVLIQFKHVLSMLNRCFGLPSGGFCFFVFHGKAMLPCLRAADVDGHKKRQIEKPV